MIALITAALAIVSVLLELWMQNMPERKKEAANEAIQKGRQEAVDANTDAVAVRLGRVLDDETDTRNCDAGSKSGVSTTGTASIEDRLSAFDIGINKAP